MKRIGNIYEKIYDIENVKLAIRNATQGKKNRGYVKSILEKTDVYAEQISEMLRKREFIPSKCRTKTIKDGSSQKVRTITVPRFYPDQIVHWAVIQVLQPIIQKGMYEYSCGSVPGRGGKAVKRYVDKVLNKDQRAKYILKLDISKFFPSIRHDKLKELLARKIKDKDTLNLLNSIIDSGGKGLPIGFYTSQWLSNFYLEGVDHFIKETLHIRHYVRYVDDMVMMDTNKRKLHRALRTLSDYLTEQGYGLKIKQNWQLWRKNSRPLDFVGYRYYGKYTLMRKRLFYHLTRTVRRIQTKGLNIYRARRFTSLLGWGKHINFKHYYKTYIRPVIPQGAVKKYISKYDRRRRRNSRCTK